MRYFEIATGGHSTLERHGHVHMVMVIRGSGEVLVGSEIQKLESFDLVEIPQNLASVQGDCGRNLRFLVSGTTDRDRPELPCEAELAQLKRDPKVAGFIRHDAPGTRGNQ